MKKCVPFSEPFSAPKERLDFKFGCRKVWADVPFFLFPLAVKTSMESTKDHTCCDCHLPLSVTLLHCNLCSTVPRCDVKLRWSLECAFGVALCRIHIFSQYTGVVQQTPNRLEAKLSSGGPPDQATILLDEIITSTQLDSTRMC